VRRLVWLVALVLAAACADDDPFAPLPKPDRVEESTTTTLPEPDLTGVALPAVGGTTTTTIGMGPGPITIVGRVEGPEGPVAGATVQLERLVGDATATALVPTAPDGTWNLPNVLGGRYRVRAWRVPDLATMRAKVVFLETGPERAIELRVEAVGGVRVDAAIAPDPPQLDQPANVKVRVAQRLVDATGVIRDQPVVGTEVRLTANDGWLVFSANPAVTGGDGGATFSVECDEAGDNELLAILADGSSHTLDVGPCVDPDATTTTAEPSEETTTTSAP
jgi:hypothetical protein